MLRQWEFHQPTRILFGPGTVAKLAEVAQPFGNRALVIGYRQPGALQPAYDQALQGLREAGLTAQPCFEITSEPPAQEIEDAAATARRFQADMVVGIGGGSILDAAKAVALLARNTDPLESFFLSASSPKPVAEALPVVAVPTTAGTGSEVTDIAVVGYCDSQGVAAKASIFGPAIRPKAALLDPDLTMHCPPGVTAACAADALAHAIEACLCRRASPMSSLVAAEAVQRISESLPRAIAAPDDPEPRQSLLLAAALAGMAISSAGVTAAHAVAHALGAILKVPHAEAVAATTPIMLRHNLPACREQYALLARSCGLVQDDPEQLPERFIEHITGLLRSAGLPQRVTVRDERPVGLVDQLVANAFTHTRIPITLNPARINQAAMAKLFEEVLGQ